MHKNRIELVEEVLEVYQGLSDKSWMVEKRIKSYKSPNQRDL